jgi:hypothetical protein
MSEKPELDLWPVQQYPNCAINFYILLPARGGERRCDFVAPQADGIWYPRCGLKRENVAL